MCFKFSLQLLSETFLILRRNERGIIINVHVYKVPVILAKILNFMKIRTVGAELFHADGDRDRHDEAENRFSQFCESV